MAKRLQLRRGTTTEHAVFTGAIGEVTVDTTKDTAVVHDGSTIGGFPLARESVLSAHTSATGNVHGITFAQVNIKPTTLSGYGITDADTSDQVTTKVNNAVSTAVSGLVNSAPGLLDTLDELANALGDDPNFATTVANNIATKVTKNADIVSGTGTKVTYDAKGLVTGSSTPTTLAGYNIGDVYTKTELDNGQLDSRYYTETEVSNALALKVSTTSAQALRGINAFSISGNIVTLNKGNGTSESVTLPAATADYEDIDDNLGLLITGVLI